jgi:hypothetical protein
MKLNQEFMTGPYRAEEETSYWHERSLGARYRAALRGLRPRPPRPSKAPVPPRNSAPPSPVPPRHKKPGR